MQKILQSATILSTLAAGIMIVSLSAAQAAPAGYMSQSGGAVQIQGNTTVNTDVQGNVKNDVQGNNNKATTNVGGVQGTVQIQGNTKTNTSVKGNVVNSVKGNNNDSQLNVGGIQGRSN